jgi:hypothetical protein
MPHFPQLLLRYLVGGPLQGIGIGVGMAYSRRDDPRQVTIGAAVGAGAAGLVLGIVSSLTGLEWLPNLTHQGGLLLQVLQGTLFGLITGVGLGGGWAWARQVWERWRERL